MKARPTFEMRVTRHKDVHGSVILTLDRLFEASRSEPRRVRPSQTTAETTSAVGVGALAARLPMR